MSAPVQNSTTLKTVGAYAPKDGFFGRPVVTRDERRETPLPHRFVYGGFEGTDTRFGFYFPEPEVYRGRFVQPLNGGLGGQEPGEWMAIFPSTLLLAASLGAYVVESNQGHVGSTECRKGGSDASIYGHRASAECARFARHLALEIYGQAPHHGYVYGGSGGGRRSINCIENVDDVWDGALPFVGAGSIADLERYDPSVPAYFQAQTFSAMFNAQRLLGDKLAEVVDALDPGGSGDPFAGLNAEQREALTDTYRLGFPRGSEVMIGYPMGQIGLWSWSAESLMKQGPEFWEAFWTKPGYVGHDDPRRLEPYLVDAEARVEKVLTSREVLAEIAAGAAELGPLQSWAGILPGDLPVAVRLAETPRGYLFGASLKVVSGKAAGRQLWSIGVGGGTLLGDGIETAGNLRFADVAPGDRIHLDNRAFLAQCYYYRHHLLPGYAEHAAFMVDGRAIYPQHAPNAMEPLMGPHFTGVFHPSKKMLYVEHAHDSSIWQVNTIRYANAVRARQGPEAEQRFRFRWIQNAEHGPPWPLPVKPAISTRFIDYQGALEQNLHDLVAWVEDGVVPPQEPYAYAEGKVTLPATAAERAGIQPVVSATANGRVRADVKVGEAVELAVAAEAPPGSGAIIAVEWDFDGTGRFPYRDESVDGTRTQVALVVAHRFDRPGVYFPAVRVTSHRQGDVKATLRRVTNLGRVRVVVT